METERKKSAVTALLPLVLLPAAYLFTGFYRRAIGPRILPCPLRFFLGVYCPGCGGTHCVYSLMSGNLPTALHYNAIIFGALVLLALYWLENVIRALGFRAKIFPTERGFYLAAAGIAVVYTVLRNFIPALAPL